MSWRVKPFEYYLPVSNPTTPPDLTEENFRERLSAEGNLLGTLQTSDSSLWSAYFNPSGQYAPEGLGYNFILMPESTKLTSLIRLAQGDRKLLGDVIRTFVSKPSTLVSFSYTDPRNFDQGKEVPNTLKQLHIHCIEYFDNPFNHFRKTNHRSEGLQYNYYSEPYPGELSGILTAVGRRAFPELVSKPSDRATFMGRPLPEGSVVFEVPKNQVEDLLIGVGFVYNTIVARINEVVSGGTLDIEELENVLSVKRSDAPNWFSILSQLSTENVPTNSKLQLIRHPAYSITIIPNGPDALQVVFRPHLFNHRGRLLDIGLAIARQKSEGNVSTSQRLSSAKKGFDSIASKINPL